MIHSATNALVRRPLRRLLGAVTAGLLFGGIVAPAHAADTVRYGAQIGAQYSLIYILKQIQGKYNLDYKFRNFRSGTENILALEQREVDVSTATTQHLLRAISENIPITWVIGWGGGYNVLIAQAGMPVKRGDYAGLKALAKKRAAAGNKIKIGVPTGSMQHLMVITALNDAGINPDKDVEIVNIPFPVHPRAIGGKEVDMVAALAFFGGLSIISKKGKVFDHLYGEKLGKQEIGFFVHQKLIDEKPDLVRRIVASHYEAIKRLRDPNTRYELEVKGSKLPPKVLAITEKQFLHVDFRTNVKDIATMASRMHKAGWSKKDLSGMIESKINFTFLEKASGMSKAQLSAW